ncbi:hypothetical protein [Nonomuraea sp. NPDC023979]|uniref:hypothetical protein n=1 Tax=Nonomuraea sp. NPDC023979 TaxID=3154796 RepID=UPI0033E4653D
MTSISDFRTSEVLGMARRYVALDETNIDEVNLAAVPLLTWLAEAGDESEQDRRMLALRHARECQPPMTLQGEQVRLAQIEDGPVKVDLLKTRAQSFLEDAQPFYDTMANASSLGEKVSVPALAS